MNIGEEHTIGRVPVRNLWLLMLYASDLYRTAGNRFSSVEETPDDIPDLVARMLVHAVERRIRRNLTAGYTRREAHLSRLRGKIDALESARNQLHLKGKIACRFDEMTINTPRNRYIKAALERLPSILASVGLARQCRSLARQLFQMGVTGDRPEKTTLSKETFGRHDGDDRQLLMLADLTFDLALPSEKLGRQQLSAPDHNEVFVRKLFEKGVAGLYEVNLKPKGWQVRAGTKLDWQTDDLSEGISRILPSMTTDIELETETQKIVIDTKFNSVLIKGWYRDSSLRSGYLYQMYAYLRSQEKNGEPKSLSSTGILLHPCVSEPLDEQVSIQGHRIRFVTIDLRMSAIDIHKTLLGIVQSNSHTEHNPDVVNCFQTVS
ncbi:5-methylcytosine-specific restriction endonuclease system specificity protein McrC [Marinobacterium sp. YM272]|uniref:5-methylcytosine-specific restriction endonuclease system specificity protein McrC n=1 Tax=Marinobacterium sp. YM272 TaxID=3421654 RepID=UPI003D7FF272